MANREHLEILMQGVEAWNSWRRGDPRLEPDLRGANLTARQLRGAWLRHADLRGAKLDNANLTSAVLRGARLNEADLGHTILDKASIRGASLSYSRLYGAYAHDADFTNADLSGATLSGGNFGQAKLVDAKLTGAEINRVNLTDADLKYAELDRSNLYGTDLTRANLSHSNLAGADMRETILTRANLCYANLSEANLESAVLGATILGDANLKAVRGLTLCKHSYGSVIDHQTLVNSGELPLVFLQGCGLPDGLIAYLPSLLRQPIQFYSCFISYSQADKSFARRLHDALQGQGIRCWLDDHQLLPGDDIFEQVDVGVRLWDKVLLCCSRDSLRSWWVDNEVNIAFDKEQQLMKQRGRKIRALIPLDLDGYMFSGEWGGGKAIEIKARLAADFTGWETDNRKFEEQFERLVRALRADAGAREAPPPPRL